MKVPSPIRPVEDRRIESRRRTRLRPVKLVTRKKRFLDDCSAIDLSPGGARVRCFGNSPVPSTLILFDEGEETLRPATVIWRVRNELGLRFTGEAEPISQVDRARLTGRYYAVG